MSNEAMQLIISYEASTADNQILKTNFDDIKAEVVSQVKKYSIEVTEDNIPEAKKVMANFNKVKTEIGEKYKFYIDKLSAPINQLKTEKKEIEAIITDGRQKIADGVAEFENKRLDEISQKINTYVKSVCDEKGLNFESIVTADLIKLTAITPAGSLAKTTKEAIDARVQALENEILKVRLETEEKAKRDREIAETAKREAEEKAAREKAEIEERARQREAEILARAEQEKEEAIAKAQEAAKQSSQPIPPKEAPKLTDDGKAIYQIQAIFEVKAPIGAPHEKLKAAVADMLKRANITSFVSLEVLNG